MKNIYLLVLFLFSIVAPAFAGEAIRLSQPVAADEATETFGAPIDDSHPAARLGDLVAAPDAWLGKPVQVKARVSEVCQKKGCFFIASDAGTTLRVSFVDYSFFVPTDAGGKRVTLVGELVRVERSDAEAAHLADDLGETSASISAGPVYEIVASAVRIPRR